MPVSNLGALPQAVYAPGHAGLGALGFCLGHGCACTALWRCTEDYQGSKLARVVSGVLWAAGWLWL